MSQIRTRILLVFGLVLCLATGAAAQSSKQVVFANSDNPANTGTFVYTNLNPKDKHFGFWIWCEGESPNPYNGVCNGAMYFYGIALTKGVFGSVSEPSENVYVMTVKSSDGKVVCTLTNVLPITSGLTNTVNAACSAPSGIGTSTKNTVVKVTGP
jgi:hypothetical protein